MRKTTSALLAGALASGAALTILSPGIAMANGCGVTNIDQTNFSKFFDTTESRSAGHNEIDEATNGLHVYTDDASSEAKAAAYQYGLSIPLKDQTSNEFYGLGITTPRDYSGGKPGYQLQIDANGLDTPGGFATLVYEPDFYQGRWWTNSANVQGVPAGDGYAHSGSLDDYVAGNPNAVITAFGYSLGSGVKGDVTIKSITFGCNEFDFSYTAPAPVNQAPDAELTATKPDADGNVTFTSESTDADGTIATQHLDYGDGTSVDGGPNDNGPVTHQYKPGTYTAVLTVTDNEGATGTDSETITYTVPVATNTGPTGALPNTGFAIAAYGVGAAALLGGGAFLMIAGRRKRAIA